MSIGEMIRMRNPAGGGCGWKGIAYAPDEHGVVTVPAAALLDLLPHEFRPVPDAPAQIAEDHLVLGYSDNAGDWPPELRQIAAENSQAMGEMLAERASSDLDFVRDVLPEHDVEEPKRYRARK